MNIESTPSIYNEAILERFKVANGRCPIDLVKDNLRVRDELFVTERTSQWYIRPKWPKLFFVFTWLFALLLILISATQHQNITENILYSVGCFSSIMLSIFLGRIISNRLEDEYATKRNEQLRLAQAKLEESEEVTAKASLLLRDLENLWKALGPKSVSMTVSELKEAVNKNLLASARGVESLWMNSPKNFLEKETFSYLEEFYGRWESFHRLELVGTPADEYFKQARIGLKTV